MAEARGNARIQAAVRLTGPALELLRMPRLLSLAPAFLAGLTISYSGALPDLLTRSRVENRRTIRDISPSCLSAQTTNAHTAALSSIGRISAARGIH